jgi:hypothetical protein
LPADGTNAAVNWRDYGGPRWQLSIKLHRLPGCAEEGDDRLADHMAAMKIGDERDDAGTEGGPGGMSVGGQPGRDGIAAATTIGAVQVHPRRDRLDRRRLHVVTPAREPWQPTPFTISPNKAVAPVSRWPGGRISAPGNLQNPAYIISSLTKWRPRMGRP